MSIKNYSPREISLIACGIAIGEGFAEDTFIEVARAEPKDFDLIIGVFGDATRVRNCNDAVTITVTLQQGADANAALSALSALDRASANGAGIAPTLVRDRAGTSLYACSESFISEVPTATYGKKLNERKWVIMGILDARVDGGN